MNDMNLCGNYEALVAYLYDECEPSERESIAAHVALCASCAEEIQSLRDTRAHLGAWAPPAMPLGFQITRIEDSQPATVLRPAAFWSRPLPAWAQVAAAVVIFAAGMGVNGMRSTGTAPLATATQSSGVVGRFAAAAPVSHDELARLEARLRSVESAQADVASVQPARTTAPSVNEQELLERVRAMVDAQLAVSEGRQRGLLALTRNELDKTAQRVDGMTERLAFMEDELPRTQDGLRTLSALTVRTSYQPPAVGR